MRPPVPASGGAVNTLDLDRLATVAWPVRPEATGRRGGRRPLRGTGGLHHRTDRARPAAPGV